VWGWDFISVAILICINPAKRSVRIGYTSKMSRLGESVQQELIQGKCEDIYYANPETTKKECIRTKQTTRYSQAFNTLSAGTNTFLIPPNFGIQQVCLGLQLPTVASTTGMALAAGWGYALIKQVSYRIGGSTQFFVSGQQILQHAVKRMTNQTAMNDLLTLGGNAIQAGSFNTATNWAYVFIDLPWSKATSEGMPVPCPSDVLGSQIQVTVELYPLSAIVARVNGVALDAGFNSLASGFFQVQQLLMESRDDSLAARENMATHQYVMPIEFVQQEQQITGLSVTAGQTTTITATGFRAGSVKSIEMWLTRNTETDPVRSSTGIVAAPLLWYAPTYVQVLYAGDVYARFDAGIGQLWNLINAKHSSVLTYAYFTGTSGSSTLTAATASSSWLTLPFAATYDCADSSHFMLVEGLNVTNGIVNIQFQPPLAASGTITDYVLHLSYIYNASAVFSQSSCELVF
jgi:hypothetical protein